MISEKTIASEQAFFDQEAVALKDEELRIAERIFDRYRRARPGALNAPKDELFARLLPLDGTEILDYGCGHGENACLLAACGARVSGFDLSPLSIATATRRAEINGLSHLTRFDVRRATETGYAPASFDHVLGFGILHHLHMILPAVYEEVARLVKPGGTACFLEPVANSATLRFLRRVTPVKLDVTEDERQLTDADLELMRPHFDSLELRYYHGLRRLHRVMGSWSVRGLTWADQNLQRIAPLVRRYYGMVLVIARAPGG